MGAETGVDRLVDLPRRTNKFGERSNGRAEPPRRRGGRRGRSFVPILGLTLAFAALFGLRAATISPPEITFVTSASTDCASTVTLVALADAWIAEGLTSNKGSDGALAVEANPGSGNSRALVRFALPGGGVPEGCVVERAVLRLYTSSGTDGARVEALRVASAWNENQVLWHTQPGTVGPASLAWSTDGYMQWNVTSHVEAMFAGGPNQGFLIRDAAEGSVEGGSGHGFESREKGENPPLLVIRFAAPSSDEPAGPPEPPAPAALSCGQVVTRSTRLTGSLSNCQDSGLVIGAPDIIVDLDGHTIDGVGLGAGILNDGFSGVTVRNGTIQGFDHGVKLLSETGSNVLEDLTVEGNELAAIELFDAWDGNEVRGSTIVGNGEGVALVSGTTGAVVTDNAMSGNSGAGLLVRDASDNRLERNSVSGGGDLGIGLERASENTLLDNDVSGNSDGGIEIRYASHGNRVEGNDVRASGDTGIMVSESDRTHLLSNTTRGMSDSGITLDSANDGVVRGNDLRLSPGGLELSDSSRNLIEANTASGNTGYGIEVGGDSFGNDLVLNVTNDNAAAGIHVAGEALTEPGNILDRNTANRNAADGINLAKGGHTIVANVVRDNKAWGIYANGANLDGLFNVATGNGQPPQCFGVVCREDWVAPETEIDSGPAGLTSSTAATFAFGGSDDMTSPSELRFDCRLDTGSFEACSSPHTYTGLTTGEHTFAVRARDRSGLVDPTPASFTWTIDTTPPETAIESGPPALSRETGASIEFSASEEGSGFECALDSAAFATCSSPAELAELGDGEHTFQVRATDPAGNTDATPASYVWTVDATAPETTIESGPPALTRETGASFSFTSTDAGAGFACTLDDGDAVPCSPGVSYAALGDGEHSFSVTATDAAGNSDPSPARHTWTIDTIPPETTIAAGPDALTNLAGASFSLASTEDGSTFACSLDGANYGSCQSPASYPGLVDGEHTFAVVATDEAGNADPSAATWSWTVDTEAPETSITDSPPALTNAASAGFAFESSESDATLACSLDGAEYAACESPASYADLGEGAHTFSVRATDAAGNTDASPATRTFTVDTVAPETTVGSGPAALTQSTSATFAFSADEDASFACSLGDSEPVACDSGVSFSTLADGTYTFSVRATDLAGNVEAEAATHTWTVDTTPPQTAVDAGPPAFTNDATPSFTLSASETGSTFECALDETTWESCSTSYTTPPLEDGAHTLSVRATDAAGNTDSSPATRSFTVDTVTPETTIDSGPSGLVARSTASFAFSADEAASFECALDEEAFAPCGGELAYEGLAEGVHTFRVRATDPAGNTDETPAERSFTVDTVAPETAIDSGPAELTQETQATFGLSASEPATFECSLDGAAFGTCLESYGGLADGSHTFRARATDTAGNTDATPAEHTWTVDTTAPVTTLSSTLSDPGNDPTPTFAFTASEPAAFRCRVDEDAYAACASPFTTGELAEGTHSFEVYATDAAGNAEGAPASRTFTIDVTAPDTTLSSTLSDPGNDPTPTFAFTASEPAAFLCRVDEENYAACASPFTTAELAEGEHTFQVRATDAAGNDEVVPATMTFTIDVTAPQTSITTAPPAGTTSTAATFTFSSTETGSTFECSLDEEPLAACSSPASYTVALGSHSFSVRATDAAGNTDASPATHDWVVEPVDTTPPETTITAGPSGATNDPTPTFAFTASETGATFECSLDDAAFTTCVSPMTTAALADGSHSFAVRATDAVGNVDETPAQRSFTVDTAAPETTIDSGPSDPTSLAAPSFSFASNEAATTFSCSLDDAAFATCASPVTTPPLDDGTHTFAVRATDEAGNTDASPASRTFTVDTVAPETTIESGPPASTTSGSASFTFGSSEAGSTFACSLDGAAFDACSSPASHSVGGGSHTFAVRATDEAGNTDATAATHSWTVAAGDTTPPETTITAGPSGPTSDATPTFSFSSSESGSTFACSLDDAEYATCASPFTTAALADGAHTFSVRATDAAGNADQTPATRSFAVDTTPPETTITAGPSGATNDATPTFSFSSSETPSTFQCSVDTGSFAACSSPFTTSTLPSGSHTFRVRAIDALGHADATPASRSLTVDTTPPGTTINSGPPSTTTNPVATFAFSSTDTTAIFECSLDTAAFAACVSPTSVTVAPGSHTFRVRAKDPAGNVDATPATRTWTLATDTTPPNTTITSAPPSTTTSTSASFTFTSTESGSTFECSLDGAAFAGCTTPATYTVAAGSHTFQVRARDAAGNVDATPASYAWTVQAPDTTPPETTITSAPPETTSDPVATFAFTSSETGSSFECSLDNTGFVPCSSPVTYVVSVGTHQLQVRAWDLAGNLDPTPAAHSWTVVGDTTPPETTITSGPSSPTTSTSASFTFTSSENGSTFECSLDGAAFSGCASPASYTVGIGSHELLVRARDGAGNLDQSPASYPWTVEAPPPGTCTTSTVTLGASADSWVLQSSASSSYGNDSVLKVDTKSGANARALVRFTLPAIAPGCQLVSAQLRLYAGSYKTGRTLEALALTTEWTESRVTWNNQPAGSGTAATVASGSGYRAWNVTSQLAAVYGSSTGFLVRDATENGNGLEQAFHSREKGTDNPPRLVLTFG